MTQDQFDAKYDELVDKFAANLKEEGRRLYKSGGIDPAAYSDNYRLPFIVLNAAAPFITSRYEPIMAGDKKAAKNLSHF